MLKRIFLAALWLPLTALAQSYPSPHFNNVTIDGTLTAATPTFTNPVPVTSGGTGSASATGSGAVVLQQAPQFTATGGYIDQIGPYAGTWVNGVYAGVFEYLETNSAVNPRGKPDGIGVFAAARSSTGAGGSTSANIGLASFGYNDYSGGAAGVWGLYTTVARASGNTGVTHGMEMDVANMGSTVTVTPYTINPAGLTEGLRIASGGEIATGNTVGAASAAMMIVRNDANATPHASFDKGIVIDANAISSAVALALPTGANGSTLQWYTSGNQDAGYITNSTTATANATHLNFSDNGAAITGNSAQQLLKVPNVASAVNYVTVKGAVSGSAPQIIASGTDTNVGLVLQPQGSGQVYVSGNLGGSGTGPLPVYNPTGTGWNAAKMVIGNVALSSGTATVTFSGASVFTASNSFYCTATDTSNVNAVKAANASASSVTFTGNGSDVIAFHCVGN